MITTRESLTSTDDGRMLCPSCGKQADFKHEVATWREPHGETFTEEWYECQECGQQIEPAELAAVNQDA